MSTFYTGTLYPLQDKTLAVLARVPVPFYLTGGTALSRGYYHHRYSDDLDFFVNRDDQFSRYIEKIINELDKHFEIKVDLKTQSYVKVIVDKILKVEWVDDVAYRFGELQTMKLYPKVDNVLNILSNKISAILSRDEAKDVVDLWVISKNNKIDWRAVFTDAGHKAGGMFPPELVKRLDSFPKELFKTVKWADGANPGWNQFKQDLEKVGQDILN